MCDTFVNIDLGTAQQDVRDVVFRVVVCDKYNGERITSI